MSFGHGQAIVPENFPCQGAVPAQRCRGMSGDKSAIIVRAKQNN